MSRQSLCRFRDHRLLSHSKMHIPISEDMWGVSADSASVPRLLVADDKDQKKKTRAYTKPIKQLILVHSANQKSY